MRALRTSPGFDIARWSGQARGVLQEIPNVRQERGAGRRRWFESEGLELVVWLDAREAVTGFQLCYDLGRGEHALTWRAGAGFAHDAVDGGDETPLKNETPILVRDGAVPWGNLVRLFTERGGGLEPTLRQFVQEKLVAQAGAEMR